MKKNIIKIFAITVLCVASIGALNASTEALDIPNFNQNTGLQTGYIYDINDGVLPITDYYTSIGTVSSPGVYVEFYGSYPPTDTLEVRVNTNTSTGLHLLCYVETLYGQDEPVYVRIN